MTKTAQLKDPSIGHIFKDWPYVAQTYTWFWSSLVFFFQIHWICCCINLLAQIHITHQGLHVAVSACGVKSSTLYNAELADWAAVLLQVTMMERRSSGTGSTRWHLKLLSCPCGFTFFTYIYNLQISEILPLQSLYFVMVAWHLLRRAVRGILLCGSSWVYSHFFPPRIFPACITKMDSNWLDLIEQTHKSSL